MRKKTLILWVCLTNFLLILLFQECIAGVVIEQQVRDREGNPSKVLLYFAENRFRTDHPESGMTTIMDFKEDRITMIDHQSKRYVQIRYSQWEKEVGEKLRKENPGITPKPRKILLKRGGETATMNGFRTERVQVFADEQLIEEDWVTRDVDMKEVENVMEKVARGFSKDFEMKEGREIYKKLKPYGFPILVKDYSITYGFGAMDVLEVKKLERKDLEDGVFLPPKGYQRIIPEPPKK